MEELKQKNAYEKLPWVIQSTTPILGIIGVIVYFYVKFQLNSFEFLGMVFSVICSFYALVQLCKFLYVNWIGIKLGHNLDLKKVGSWAVVTGSTQGIGKAYANALAKRGLNLVLIARSPDKLNQVANEIRELYDVKVKLILADFSLGAEIYDKIESELKGLEIGTLINNVGISYQYPEYFGDLAGGREFVKNMINCNILSVTLMTHIVLPGMVQRKKGVVVNVGSISGILDSPFLTLYGSTKAFGDKFTTDLELEYRDHGILFQSLVPGYIVSSMSKIKKSSIFVPTPDDFVEAALNAIGLQKRTAAWVSHQFLYYIARIGLFFRRDGASEVNAVRFFL